MRLPELVAHTADRSPDRVAVEMGDTCLSYRELRDAAGRYARALRQQGIGVESVVAVSLSRTPHLIAVLLGILEAGAAYLPLDPAYPPERQRQVLEDAGAALHLTDDNWRTTLAVAAPAIHGDERPPELAYVIYTSGSTGRAKGVEVTHDAVAAFVGSMAHTPGMTAADRVLAHTTLSFDIHVLEIWVPLCVGATIVLVASDVARDPAALAACISERHVTIVQATPSMWTLLLRAGWRDGAGVKALAGGEALPRDLADALLATGADLWNMYGPTETTVWSAAWHVSASGPIVIGTPVDGTTLHVLPQWPASGDATHLRELPAGETGELCIGGRGLARGYRHRPELTAERFIMLPPPDGGRLYRTGDLARRLPDGSIECLGRLDQQVKVGGNRIEPGDVEAALRRVPGVADAVVAAADGPLGLRQLVAYVVPAPGVTVDGSRLRPALAAVLPDYLVPSLYVPLPAVPLTANGKVNRAALPRPALAIADDTPPATASEVALHEIWCTVFGRQRFGVLENFFDSGGHSRLAAWLLALVADRLDVQLPLSQLMAAPTIRALAACIDQVGGGFSAEPVVCLTSPPTGATASPPSPRSSNRPRPTLFLAHAAGGHAVLYRDLARHLSATCDVCVFQSRGLDGHQPPDASVKVMARRYVEALRSRQPRGPYAIGGASFGGVVAWEMAGQLREAGDTVDLLLLIDAAFPPVGTARSLRTLAHLPGFQRFVYPWLRRTMAHATAVRRLGLRRYAGWLMRDRRSSRAEVEQRIAQQVGPTGRSLLSTLTVVREANERALANALPRRYDGPALFLRARDGRDEHDTRDHWRQVGGAITYVDVPGNHGTCLLEPHVAATAALIQQAFVSPDGGASSAASRLPLPPPRPDHVPA